MSGLQAVHAALELALDRWRAQPVDRHEFLGELYEMGLAAVSFPVGRGGLGVDARLQGEVSEALRTAGAPEAFAYNPIGVGMAAPTIVTHGDEAQQDRWLAPLFRADELWCQLFSEPDAGSDLAGVTTTARRDGESWVVDGQKVWTSVANRARWGLLLARTDGQVPKHRGLTYFVVDMRSAGVDVRPLRQLTGDAEFSEVFFSEVRVPDADRLGAVGAGWSVAITTLMNERVSLGGDAPPRGSGPIADAIDTWRRRVPTDAATERVRRDRLAHRWIDAEVLRLTNLRAAAARRHGAPGPEGSVGKIRSAELNQEIRAFVLEVLGPDAMLAPVRTDAGSVDTIVPTETDPRWTFLRSRANTIEGGTSEVLRNVLAERVLGLPAEVRVDKDRPFDETRTRETR